MAYSWSKPPLWKRWPTVKEPEVQLAERTIPIPESGCLVWLGLDINGYGLLIYRGQRLGAHRVAYELAYGPIPEGMYVCHHCDVRGCCEPTHLFLGTQQDNLQDASQKGRLVKSEAWRAKLSARMQVPKSSEYRQKIAAGVKAYFATNPDLTDSIAKGAAARRGRKRPAHSAFMSIENKRRAALRKGLPWPPLSNNHE